MITTTPVKLKLQNNYNATLVDDNDDDDDDDAEAVKPNEEL